MMPTAATKTAAQPITVGELAVRAKNFATRRNGGVRVPPTHSSSQCFAFQARQRSRMVGFCLPMPTWDGTERRKAA